jgi:hypothetical protein
MSNIELPQERVCPKEALSRIMKYAWYGQEMATAAACMALAEETARSTMKKNRIKCKLYGWKADIQSVYGTFAMAYHEM